MSISQQLTNISQQIEQHTQQAKRPLDCVKLLAVSKTKPISDIEQAILAGQYCFGENYVQEAVEKIQFFANSPYKDKLAWHFIGLLQSNKTRVVAEHFDWVQTVDRLKIAERLSQQRPSYLPPLNVLIQINICDEQSKSGISPDEMLPLATQIQSLPHLKLRGLMAIPKPESDPLQQKIALAEMKRLFIELQRHFEEIDTLSMGMSDDMQSAIECGSTMVRIGTAIFGKRS